ncbi:MAG: hypothetical protein K2P86_14650 [Xanthobacteraceae bacterium]|nr:hypothetical protein [Xanthobacteraceae bacterium]
MPLMRILAALLFSLFIAGGANAQSGSGDTPSPSQSPSQSTSPSRSLSNAEAIQVISTEWNELVGWLLIGERVVASDVPPADCKSEAMNPQQFDFLLNAERAGLVTIRYWDDRGAFLKDKDYTNKEKIEFAVAGRLQKMTIIPTKEAQQEQVKLEIHNRTGCMSFKVGRYEINTVTENRSLRKGTTELAAVTVLYRVDYAPIYRQVYTAGKVKIDNMRKANVLLRFDPPRKRWHAIAFDAANAGEEIKPVNVPQAYKKVQ